MLIKYWPKVDPGKEVSCLNDLEAVLDTLKSISPIIEVRHYLVSKVAECAQSLHFSVAERALLLLHNPVLLCLISYDKRSLLQIVVDALLQNTYRRDTVYLKLLEQNGTFTQKSPYEDLRGAHWNRSVRGLTVVVMKLLCD